MLCDLTLIADHETMKVHRAVMAASSDYFKALLTLDMKEKDQSVIHLKGIEFVLFQYIMPVQYYYSIMISCIQRDIIVHSSIVYFWDYVYSGVPAKGLSEVVRFAYTGNLRCSLGNISDVLLAATHLQLTEAIDLCSHFLTNITCTSNSVHMYNLAEQFNLPKLCSKSLTLIVENFEDVAERGDYLHFSEKFLAQILEDSRLRSVSELRLFQLTMNWINFKTPERLKFAHFLMSRIRIPLIPPQSLAEFVMNEKIMKNDPQCLELVLEASKYHMLPQRQPLMQNLRTKVRSDTPSIMLMDVDDEGPKVFDLGTRNWGTLRVTNIDTFHAQVCALQNYMYVCGGIELYSSNNPVSAKCYRYDPRFDSWTDLYPMEQPRHHFILCSDGRSLYAIGGYCNGIYKSVVEQFAPKHNRWVTRKSMDHGLSAGAATVLDGRIFVCGGQNERGIMRSLCRYTIKTDQWHDCPPMYHPRMDHTMCSYGQRLFVVGGYDKNIIKAFDVNKIEVFDLETNQWSVVAECGPKISGIYSCQVGMFVYIVGGFSYDENKKRSEVWCYNIEVNEWKVIAKLVSPTMSVPCCALYLPANILRDIGLT